MNAKMNVKMQLLIIAIALNSIWIIIPCIVILGTRTVQYNHKTQLQIVEDEAFFIVTPNLTVNTSTLLKAKHFSACHNCQKVTCEDVFNRHNVDLAMTIMEQLGDNVVNDTEVINMTDDCQLFKTSRMYILYPLSKASLEFPIAYSIVVHQTATQVERLLRALYRPHNYYCLHVDLSASPLFQEAMRKLADCFDNVFIPSKRVRVKYATFSRLYADIVCIEELLQRSKKWKYLINLAGQAFPLKTNEEIVDILKIYNGTNDIEGITRRKLQFRWTFRWKVAANLEGAMTFQKTKEKKAPPPHNLKMVKGSAYGVLSRDFAYFSTHSVVAKDFMHWSMDTYSPDEHYWATLHHLKENPHLKSPGGYSGYPDTKKWMASYSAWQPRDRCGGKFVHFVCIFGVKDLPKLAGRHELFANKLYYDFQPITLDCLEQWIHAKTWAKSDLNLTYYKNLPFVNYNDDS